MDEPSPQKTPPILEYGRARGNETSTNRISTMRYLGIVSIPIFGGLGVLMLALGILDRNYQGLAIAGSILIGAILIALSLPDRR